MPRATSSPRPARPRLSAEQRRESILQAATEVFATKGYQATKVSDIAARVGVTEPVIFQNFGSKAALYGAVLERISGELRDGLHALVEQHGSATELLIHALVPARGNHDGPLPAHGLLFLDATALGAEPALSAQAADAVRAVADHLADIVRRGQEDGDIRLDVDPDAAAWLLISVLSGRPVRAATAPDHAGLEEALAALAVGSLSTGTATSAGRRAKRRPG